MKNIVIKEYYRRRKLLAKIYRLLYGHMPKRHAPNLELIHDIVRAVKQLDMDVLLKEANCAETDCG